MSGKDAVPSSSVLCKVEATDCVCWKSRAAEHSPGGYSLVACLVAEVVLTLMFLMIILGATDRRAPQGFAPIAIGLGLTLIHLIGIPVTNLSVNPARSTGPALLVGGCR